MIAARRSVSARVQENWFIENEFLNSKTEADRFMLRQ